MQSKQHRPQNGTCFDLSWSRVDTIEHLQTKVQTKCQSSYCREPPNKGSGDIYTINYKAPPNEGADEVHPRYISKFNS